MKNLNVLSWFDKDTVKHLRLPFSLYLMPVFLFALSQADSINWPATLLSFLILHVLIFPSSNGYNSYQDRDETSIGGLKYPPKVSRNLFYVTLLFDIAGVLSGLIISTTFSLFLVVLIIMSRAYSYRSVRLKKYPVIGFLTVFAFQGAFVYMTASSAITNNYLETYATSQNLICMCMASLFIGSMYPLTQIYQHDSDKKDGVTSLSYALGYSGTFAFSAALFAAGTVLLFLLFNSRQHPIAFVIFLAMMLPVIVRLIYWTNKVHHDTIHANFENTMKMNGLVSTCMNLYFLLLIFNRFGKWF